MKKSLIIIMLSLMSVTSVSVALVDWQHDIENKTDSIINVDMWGGLFPKHKDITVPAKANRSFTLGSVCTDGFKITGYDKLSGLVVETSHPYAGPDPVSRLGRCPGLTIIVEEVEHEEKVEEKFGYIQKPVSFKVTFRDMWGREKTYQSNIKTITKSLPTKIIKEKEVHHK